MGSDYGGISRATTPDSLFESHGSHDLEVSSLDPLEFAHDEEMNTGEYSQTQIHAHTNCCKQCDFIKSNTSLPVPLVYMICTGNRAGSNINFDHFAACIHCEKSKGKSKAKSSDEWLMDSGATLAFTHDLNDFAEYEEFTPGHVTALTASDREIIKGQGTVFIKHGWKDQNGKIHKRTTRVYPVYHMPRVTQKLLSMGDFLVHGNQTMVGDQKGLSFYDCLGRPQMVCHPRSSEHQTLFWLHAHTTVSDSLLEEASVYSWSSKVTATCIIIEHSI